MLQTMAYDFQQASTEAQAWSGALVSLCTIQQPSGNKTPYGQPDGTFTNVSGLVNIPCMDAVLTDGSIQATEVKALSDIMSKAFRHIFLDGCYPQLFTSAAAVGGGPLGWRAVVDGVAYDLLGGEPDSQLTQTRLKLQLVTVS